MRTWTPIEQEYERGIATEGARLHRVKYNKWHIRGGRVPE